jgi:hypothetical protein
LTPTNFALALHETSLYRPAHNIVQEKRHAYLHPLPGQRGLILP